MAGIHQVPLDKFFLFLPMLSFIALRSFAKTPLKPPKQSNLAAGIMASFPVSLGLSEESAPQTTRSGSPQPTKYKTTEGLSSQEQTCIYQSHWKSRRTEEYG